MWIASSPCTFSAAMGTTPLATLISSFFFVVVTFADCAFGYAKHCS